MKLNPNHLSSVMAGFIFFVPTAVGENELPKGQAKVPQECPRQKVFFIPTIRDKNRHKKLIMDAI